MLKRYFQPYTFRGRLMIALYISAAFSAVVSLLFAYVIAHVNVQSELQLQQQAIGVYLLEMDNRTDLSTATMLGMLNDVEDTHVEQVDLRSPDLPKDLPITLALRQVVTVLDDVTRSPVTYVQLSEGVVCISSLYGRSLFVVAFFRIISTSLSFLAVFVLMTTFASFRLSKPVQVLTRAHERVQEGDFTVRLQLDCHGKSMLTAGSNPLHPDTVFGIDPRSQILRPVVLFVCRIDGIQPILPDVADAAGKFSTAGYTHDQQLIRVGTKAFVRKSSLVVARINGCASLTVSSSGYTILQFQLTLVQAYIALRQIQKHLTGSLIVVHIGEHIHHVFLCPGISLGGLTLLQQFPDMKETLQIILRCCGNFAV